MGLFDSIRGALNPDIISKYNYIVSNHKEAFEKWRGRQIVGTLSELFWHKPTYNDKYYIATHESEILRVEQEIAEEKAFLMRKQQVVDAFSKYPHAMYSLIKRLSIPSIPGFRVVLPGVRKSKRTRRINSSAPSPVILPKVDLRVLTSVQAIPNKVGFNKPTRTKETLTKAEYENIYKHLSSLPTEERKICEELREEDILIKFDDEILDNNKRSKYYQQYLQSKNLSVDNKEYCINHIDELDKYILNLINSNYRTLKLIYPDGVEYVENYLVGYGETKEDAVIEHENDLQKWDSICKKYQELKLKYPLGLPAFEDFNSFDDGKHSASLTIEEVVDCEEEIAKFQKFAPISKFYSDWLKNQENFSSKCRELFNQFFEGWGCYKYEIPFIQYRANGEKFSRPYKIWQFFCESFSHYNNPEFVSLFPSRVKNLETIPRLISGKVTYKDKIYDKILSFILKLVELYPNEVEVIFAKSGREDNEVITKHFDYISSKLNEFGIRKSTFTKSPFTVEEKTHIVVIDLITHNKDIKDTCDGLLNIKSSCFDSCLKQHRFTCFSDIIYISILKELDSDESIALLNKTIQKRKEEEERRKAHEAEQKRIAEQKKRDEEIKRLELQDLKNCVSSWQKPNRSTVSYFALYYYYPINCEWEASEEEWEIRNIVWGFKANPHNNQPEFETKRKQLKAIHRIIIDLRFALPHFFNDKLSKLTFVCLPASSKQATIRRFKSFSDLVCRELNLVNGFDHVTIIKDGISKNDPSNTTGHSIPAEISLDESFFTGKYVLLFDDVITTGASIERFKNQIEAIGAHVIGAMSVGKTKHERQISNPIDSIF